jgi:hypothetical protein
MFNFDVIFWVDNGIIIGIIVSKDFDGDSFNISTVPVTFTFFTELFFTIEISVFWTVFSSPLVFNHDHTIVEFTESKRSRLIGITVV